MNKIKKLFGEIELSWKKTIIFAVAAGVYTALMTLIPQLKYTSFITITATFEVWILFGIIIIMNSKSNKDSALKCFVFFLISQPIVYLLQVPFNGMGWGLFRYYKPWFIWTLLCLPMGFFGYYIKKDKWYGYLMLFPMIVMTLFSFYMYFRYFTFDCPAYLLISVFCAAMALIYPNVLFENRKIKITGTVISAVLILAIAVIVLVNPYRYSPVFLSTVDGKDITEEYNVELEDPKYGDVHIEYMASVDAYMVHADFKKSGKTALLVTDPEGRTVRYDLTIKHDGYEWEKH